MIANPSIHLHLATFPIAFYLTACVAYLYYAMVSFNAFWFKVAYIANSAGVTTALIAVIPGVIEWTTKLPKGSRARRNGMIHMTFNGLALSLFTLSAGINYDQFFSDSPSAQWGAILCLIGAGLTFIAGYWGFKLVNGDPDPAEVPELGRPGLRTCFSRMHTLPEAR